jgi:Kef-type K+ transport system membrane component KefB
VHTDFFQFLREHLFTLPALGKFAVGMTLIIVLPTLSRRLHVPEAVGLLLGGVIVGPYVLDIFGAQRPIAEFMGELGKLLLMFFAGLEIDLALFRRAQTRSVIFGLTTTSLPLLLGAAAGLFLGYAVVPAIVIGSLLASHTLLGLGTINRLGMNRLEPITVTVGATVMSDTLSLVVFAVCVSLFTTGFSAAGLALLLAEVIGYVLLVLFGLSRVGAWVLGKFEGDEDVYFIVMLAILAVAAVLAELVQLPGIVGAFLAGLAVNATTHEKPASAKLQFFGRALFIPIFFLVTGFLINPMAFASDIIANFPIVAALVAALLIGKWLAAELTGRAFHYSPIARATVWSLTLPQVAATLAATLVAYKTFDHAGRRLLDGHLLNAVLVLVLVTAILGPVLTERFAPRMLAEEGKSEEQPSPTPRSAGA